ncbi:hypothetical protein BKA70DRAFT_1507885 [Coprinopsis sp. MPI-PUGE-AT-0042]|nr:hypothetical protein BKA70DRAFT_1507885 [Coprinopsis sp. MPI-PUGE-AT-0042]
MIFSRTLAFVAASSAWLVSAAPASAGNDMNPYAAAVSACEMVRNSPDLSPAFPGTVQYTNDVSHWSNASSLPSMCTVEPGTPQEIQRLGVAILGISSLDQFEIIKTTRTPWAVKGKGHCNNNNMSSTTGLQIAMSEFSQIELASDKKSVKIGSGLDWGQVYDALVPQGLVVVGGRSPGVGVAGLLLSAGYGWNTNEYGFAIDNIISADVVLPNGTFTTVSETQGSDIFYALQGGVNNFGIVTSFTLKTFPIGKVWGGTIYYPTDQIDALIDASVEYAAKPSIPKATLATELFANNGTLEGAVILFYDGETPPAGLFDTFLEIPRTNGEAKTHDSFTSFLSVVTTGADGDPPNNRATWYSAPILSWPREIIKFIAETATEYSIKAAQQSRSIKRVTGSVPPFGPQAYSFNRGSAWPHNSSEPSNTFGGLFQWSDAEDDEVAFSLVVEYHNKIWEKAIELGISKGEGEVFYPPNYAQSITPPSMIYGDNLPWLHELKNKVDPDDIISLTGGFKI